MISNLKKRLFPGFTQKYFSVEARLTVHADAMQSNGKQQ